MFGLRGVGVPELLIVLAIVVLVFGTAKLTGVGGAIGNSIREFRKAVRDDDEPKPEPVSEKESKDVTQP